MIGAIAGDIVGSRFEGDPAPPPGFALFHPDCRFTDDSVCSLGVADALMGNGDFAASLRRFVRLYPRAGYGAMFLRWALRDGAPAYGSWANWAPMRVAAVGWLATSSAEADRLAAAQACVSHDHPDAIAASQAVARAIFELRHGASPGEVRSALAEECGYDLRPEVALRPAGFDLSAAGTVRSALAAAFEAASWEEAVRNAVGLGGDTDTLACIAGGVAEAAYGLPATIGRCVRERLPDDLLAVLDRFERVRPSP